MCLFYTFRLAYYIPYYEIGFDISQIKKYNRLPKGRPVMKL